MTKALGFAAPDRTLIGAGVLLFLIGLLTGFAAPMLTIPRMGLASHLEGLLNGLFLIALGLIWGRISLPAWAGTVTLWAVLYGAFANWLATLLAAIWGAGGMMPLAGGGRVGGQTHELIVAVLLVTLSLAMVLTCLMVLWGLRRGRRAANAP